MKAKKILTTKDLVLAALFAGLISIGSYLKISTPLVPFSMQIFFVLLAGQVLTPAASAVSLFGYISLGIIGLPVFSGGGGIAYALKPSFGYIIGFLFSAVFISFFIQKSLKKGPAPLWYRLIINFAGDMIVYVFGIGYYCVLNVLYFHKVLEFWPVFVSFFLIFMPSDMLFCFLSALAAKRSEAVLKRRD